ncbi:MAG: hypothetical protein M3279_05970 [Actinomycetota bacterium]|nr:hypothetical protein [Actinomycetota bacterium]
MSDQIKIQQGAAPWAPTDDAEVVETFLRYDFPRTGIVMQGARRYLFACIDEYGPNCGLWAYIAIDDGDEDRLRNSADESVAYFEAARKPITIAVADADRGIFHSADYLRESSVPFLKAAAESVVGTLEEFRKYLEAQGAVR